jgi:hypothetical protein
MVFVLPWMGQPSKGFAGGYFSDRAGILLGQLGLCKNFHRLTLDSAFVSAGSFERPGHSGGVMGDSDAALRVQRNNSALSL